MKVTNFKFLNYGLCFLIIVSCQHNQSKPLTDLAADSTAHYLKEIQQLAILTGDPILQHTIELPDSNVTSFLKLKIAGLKQDSNSLYSFLNRTEEPIFNLQYPTIESYRMTWMRTFDSKAYVVRIDHQNSQIKITTKTILVAKEISPNVKDTFALLDSTVKIIDEAKWTIFINLIHDAQFWAAFEEKSEIGLDGSWWTMEGIKTSKHKSDYQHHIKTSWSPGQTNFGNACYYLLELTGLDFGEIY